jgi:hypothetical protein
MFEIQNRRPIIRFVFLEPTRRARSELGDVSSGGVHGQVEAVVQCVSRQYNGIGERDRGIRTHSRTGCVRLNIAGGNEMGQRVCTYPSNNLVNMRRDLSRGDQPTRPLSAPVLKRGSKTKRTDRIAR